MSKHCQMLLQARPISVYEESNHYVQGERSNNAGQDQDSKGHTATEGTTTWVSYSLYVSHCYEYRHNTTLASCVEEDYCQHWGINGGTTIDDKDWALRIYTIFRRPSTCGIQIFFWELATCARIDNV